MEVSRVSSVSPMTPNGPRSIASGLDESLRDMGKSCEGSEEGLPRSPCSPTRRLWDLSEGIIDNE